MALIVFQITFKSTQRVNLLYIILSLVQTKYINRVYEVKDDVHSLLSCNFIKCSWVFHKLYLYDLTWRDNCDVSVTKEEHHFIHETYNARWNNEAYEEWQQYDNVKVHQQDIVYCNDSNDM